MPYGPDEVTQVKVYDELSAVDRRRGRKHARKEKVLDVVTKEHLLALFIKRDYLGSFRVSLAGLTAYAQPDSLPDLLTELAKARTQLLVMDHLFFSML